MVAVVCCCYNMLQFATCYYMILHAFIIVHMLPWYVMVTFLQRTDPVSGSNSCSSRLSALSAVRFVALGRSTTRLGLSCGLGGSRTGRAAIMMSAASASPQRPCNLWPLMKHDEAGANQCQITCCVLLHAASLCFMQKNNT